MINRVVATIYNADVEYEQEPGESAVFADRLMEQIDQQKVVFSTPILNNAGISGHKMLSACVVPIGGHSTSLSRQVNRLHQNGMGTGYNLDQYNDPVGFLLDMNKLALKGVESGREDRPVGNIAVMSVRHPGIRSFIRAKADFPGEWKFNLSVNVDDSFFEAVTMGGDLVMNDGTCERASDLFDLICESALYTGDPGLIRMDKLNERNPTPGLGIYESVSPCAEVGLSKGEVCHFAYVNLGQFINTKTKEVDATGLGESVRLLVRALDDCVDITLAHATDIVNSALLRKRRKIGVGICGLADALTLLGIPYDSVKARSLARDIVQQINYYSKRASFDLAASRGSAEVFRDPKEQNRYLSSESFLMDLAGASQPNATISYSQWLDLALCIKKSGQLRNTTTTALPPTGRSGRIVDASPGIEPHFITAAANKKVRQRLASVRSESRLHANAQEIDPIDHVLMAAELQSVIDESISKTINMPRGTTKQHIADIYRLAYEKGLIGITVYVDGTHAKQPVKLGVDNG